MQRQGMCELNEPTANIDPKTVLAEGQAVLQNLKHQREAVLPNPELRGSQLSTSFPAAPCCRELTPGCTSPTPPAPTDSLPVPRVSSSGKLQGGPVTLPSAPCRGPGSGQGQIRFQLPVPQLLQQHLPQAVPELLPQLGIHLSPGDTLR